VLSQTDLSVIALTYQYEVVANGDENIRTTPGEQIRRRDAPTVDSLPETEDEEPGGEEDDEDENSADETQLATGEGETSRSIEQVLLPQESPGLDPPEIPEVHDVSSHREQETSELSRPSGNGHMDHVEDIPLDGDSEGDWITPANVSSHRNHDLGLLPADGTSFAPNTPIGAACMTGDFAVQNVLLGMGMGLVGEGGKRISKVRNWVLRCHACFK